jgi:hypothetical protein
MSPALWKAARHLSPLSIANIDQAVSKTVACSKFSQDGFISIKWY